MNCAFIFPGQGSQSVGMGHEIYDNFSVARELLEEASDYVKIDFKNLLFTQNENLPKSEFTQPAIVLNSLMTYKVFQSRLGLEPIFSLGHSLGEFSALAVSGAFDFKDAIKLVNLRGRFMQEDCDGKDAGMMVILGLSDEKVVEICKEAQNQKKEIYAANFNSDGQIVIAGIKKDLSSLESEFKTAGAKRAMLLDMSVASHCPILENASQKLYAQLKDVLKANFKPVVANVVAKTYSTKEEALYLLKAQLVSPVLYKQSITNYENKVDCFIEFGANILKGINKKITDKPTLSITDISSLEETIKFLEDK